MTNKYNIVVPFALILVVSVFGAWGYASAVGDQITICAKKSGLVYVIGEDFKRKDCKATDQLLSFNVSGPKGDKGDVGPRGPAGESGEGLHLYDADDQDLGIFLDHDLYISGYTFTTYEQEIELPLSFISSTAWGPATLQVSGGNVVKFTELNCAGQAFTENQDFPFQKLWRITTRNEANDVTSRYFTSSHFTQAGNEILGLSVLYSDGSGSTVENNGKCENIIDPMSSIGFPLTEVNLPFTEPLAWPLHIQ